MIPYKKLSSLDEGEGFFKHRSLHLSLVGVQEQVFWSSSRASRAGSYFVTQLGASLMGGSGFKHIFTQ